MKRLILIFMSVLFLFGCNAKEEVFQSPVQFYYMTTHTADTASSGLIQSETREGFGYENSLSELISLYLQGPQSPSMVTPFPAGTTLTSLSINGSTVNIVFNSAYASLTGYRLTFANICLAQTIFALTDASQVCVSIHDGLLDNQESITIDKSFMIQEDIIGSTAE